MTQTLPPEKTARIAQATAALDIAQREVERVMKEITADAPRAHKTIITDALRVAFEKLNEAREKLQGLAPEP